MKLFLILLGLAVFISGSAARSSDLEFDGTAVAIHDIHKRDIFDSIRNTLNGLVNGLQNAATDFNNALTQFLNTSKEWRENILNGVQNTTNQWLNDVQNTVNQVLNSTTSVIESVVTCVTSQQNNAVDLINGTIKGVITCVENVVDEVMNSVVDGSALALNAANLAINISGQILNCGIANILNFAQVGICLNTLVQKYTNDVNVLIGKIVSFTTMLGYNVVSIPTTFTSCMGSTVAISVFQIINIVQEIPACIVNTVG